MLAMDATRWKLIERLYEEVRELPEAQRNAYLNSHPDSDSGVVAEVTALLKEQEQAVSFFEDFREDLFAKIEEAGEKRQAPSRSLIGEKIGQHPHFLWALTWK